MHHRSLRRIILPLLVILALFFLLTVELSYNSARPPQSADAYIHNGKVDFSKAHSYWTERIRAIGPVTAHVEFVQVASSLPTSQAHVLAHVFGESLFSAKGADGFAFCDAMFLYGCFHQLIGSAISALGISVVEKFGTNCAQKPIPERFSCLHGMGHGILGYYGYSLENLNSGLEVCGRLDSGNAGSACARGMFMEYNLHELAARETGNIVDPRPFLPETKYAPCEAVAENNRAACYTELPNWWITTADAALSISESFAQAGTWCAAIARTDPSQSCFEGLGHIAPPATDLDYIETRKLCEATSAIVRDRLHCLSSAARRFKVEGIEDTSVLCKKLGLEGDSLTYCRDFAN